MASGAETVAVRPGVSLLIPEEVGHNHFNSLRLGMALLVIWSHCFAIYHGSEEREPISLLMNGTYNAGNIGVRVFFVISGFLILMSYERSRNVPGYLKKRVARIYPGFLAAMAICSFVVIPLFSSSVDFGFASIVRTMGGALLLQANFPVSDVFSTAPHHSATVNGALWSIPFEFWCYLGIIACGALGFLRRAWVLVLALLTIIAIRIWCDLHGLKPGGGILGAILGWPYLWLSIAPCFLSGMIVHLYRHRLPRSAVLAFAILLLLLTSARISPLLCDAVFPACIAYLTFWVAFGSWRIPDAARHGDFSYGTYLYGFPIQQMLMEARLPFAVYVSFSMALSVAAGVLSWFIVERHFLTRKSIQVRTGEAVEDQLSPTAQQAPAP